MCTCYSTPCTLHVPNATHSHTSYRTHSGTSLFGGHQWDAAVYHLRRSIYITLCSRDSSQCPLYRGACPLFVIERFHCTQQCSHPPCTGRPGCQTALGTCSALLWRCASVPPARGSCSAHIECWEVEERSGGEKGKAGDPNTVTGSTY